MIDFGMRHGFISPDDPGYAEIRLKFSKVSTKSHFTQCIEWRADFLRLYVAICSAPAFAMTTCAAAFETRDHTG